MSDQSALLAAIVAKPDEDMPRLAYADWLDENLPDGRPSPSSGPSARAEYIRVQCALARLPFDAPDYPELLEREEDLAAWLGAHTDGDEEAPRLPDCFEWSGSFDSGDDRDFCRGFPAEMCYEDYEDEPQDNIDRILPALADAFAHSTVRTLRMEDAYGAEIAGVVADPVVAGLRGLLLSDIADDDEDTALRAIADSPHLGGLRRLAVDFGADEDSLRRLAKARHLGALEHFSLDYPTPAGLKPLGEARWFRNLRSLQMWLDNRDTLKTIAEFPVMPDLAALALHGGVAPTAAAVRKFAASGSFPRLAKLELTHTRLTPELVAVLAPGEWPLRHLRLNRVSVRKAGAEALAGAAFAGTLRVLELSDCEITAGGAAALAASAKLAGLRHLDLSNNPLGAGGLAALVRSKHLRGLRALDLSHCNTPKAPLDAAALFNFLSALEMPELRHLSLDRLPVGVRGGRVLGAGGSFANLTRLKLSTCGLRENGARAIAESDTLPHLTALYLTDNAAGKGVAKLADPKTFPKLAVADVSQNRVPRWTLSRLRKRPGVRV
ncbi:MAG: TIGR02996 domain-containing protein [Planctomycetes bacterium]|nr:TIGR02996 domain-containing protein [Planctomycetota bacterium]